jgi:hypothetical protein
MKFFILLHCNSSVSCFFSCILLHFIWSFVCVCSYPYLLFLFLFVLFVFLHSHSCHSVIQHSHLAGKPVSIQQFPSPKLQSTNTCLGPSNTPVATNFTTSVDDVCVGTDGFGSKNGVVCNSMTAKQLTCDGSTNKCKATAGTANFLNWGETCDPNTGKQCRSGLSCMEASYSSTSGSAGKYICSQGTLAGQSCSVSTSSKFQAPCITGAQTCISGKCVGKAKDAACSSADECDAGLYCALVSGTTAGVCKTRNVENTNISIKLSDAGNFFSLSYMGACDVDKWQMFVINNVNFDANNINNSTMSGKCTSMFSSAASGKCFQDVDCAFGLKCSKTAAAIAAAPFGQSQFAEGTCISPTLGDACDVDTSSGCGAVFMCGCSGTDSSPSCIPQPDSGRYTYTCHTFQCIVLHNNNTLLTFS